MHIPVAEGSTLPVFFSLFADIGDEQNIEESLSTFSAHIRRLNQITQEADEHSLILIDELGAGTDPAEGAALGLALLDHLRMRRCSIAITTHLTLLKTYAYHHRDVQNVSVAFDPITLKPTYNLIYWRPRDPPARRQVLHRVGSVGRQAAGSLLVAARRDRRRRSPGVPDD